MSQLFKPPLDISSSESDDEESSCEEQNLSSLEHKKTADRAALIKVLQDILEAESAADSSKETEAGSSLENNEPKELVIKEYNFVSKPAISNIKEVKLLTLKKWKRRVEVIKSEKFPNLKKRYFDELNDFVNKWRLEGRGLVLEPIKESNLPFVFEDIMSAISTELKKPNLKPMCLLKALYYFFTNFTSLVAENTSSKDKCILSLKKFVTNTLKCKTSQYLFKDIAADILSELGCVSLPSAAAKLLKCNFLYLQEFREDLSGTTITWLCNVTPKTGAKLLRSETEFSDTLTLKALNSPKIFRRLILVCESNVCCSPDELENISLTEGSNIRNQSKDSSQMETDVLTQSEEVSSLLRKPFYDRNLLRNLNDLIRHETIYTPIFHFKYDPRETTPNKFLDMAFNEIVMRHLSDAPKKYLHVFAKRDSETTSASPKDLMEASLTEKSHKTDSLQHLFVTENKESYMNDSSFWNSWDVFSGIETTVDTQRAYFGGSSTLKPEFDVYSREKANTHQISVDISDMDPMNIKASSNVFDCFKMPDSYAAFQKKKSPRKRKNTSL